MSTESSESVATKKRRGTSIPLLVGFIVLGAVGYFFGEKIMTYVFYLQEVMIARSISKGGDLPGPVEFDPNANTGLGSGPDPSLGSAPGGSSPESSGPGVIDPASSSAESPAFSNPGAEAPASPSPASVASGAASPPSASGQAPDPEAMFAQRDKDSNGKLEGDEIGERMQARLSEVDTDDDKAVSKDEFLTAWRNRQTAGSSSSGSAAPGAPRTPSAEAPK